MALDPHYAAVSILCPFTEDYNSLKEDAGVYTAGTGIVAGSMAVYGYSDYWRASNTALLPSGTADFTVEGWTYLDAYVNPLSTVANLYQSNAQGWRLSALSDGTIRLELLDDFFAIIHPSSVGLGVWFHWAVTRASGVFNLWIDGVGATARASTLSLAPSYLYLGAPGWSTGTDELDGFYNELRVTLGLSRYAADFTPPSGPFPRASHLWEGIVTDSAGNPAAREVRLVNRATGALVDTTTSDAVTGRYEFGVTPGAWQAICLDSGATLQDQIQRFTIA